MSTQTTTHPSTTTSPSRVHAIVRDNAAPDLVGATGNLHFNDVDANVHITDGSTGRWLDFSDGTGLYRPAKDCTLPGGEVAVPVGENATLFLSPAEARKLATYLRAAAKAAEAGAR